MTHLPETADELAPIPDWMIQPPEVTTMRRMTNAGRFWLLWLTLMVVLAMGTFWTAYANAQAARTAMITFTAPTTRTDDTTITGALSYELYQGLKGQAKTKVSTFTGSATTVNSGLAGGNEYCWAIVAFEAGNATPSAMSADSPTGANCKKFDQSGPNVVTITVT